MFSHNAIRPVCVRLFTWLLIVLASISLVSIAQAQVATLNSGSSTANFGSVVVGSTTTALETFKFSSAVTLGSTPYGVLTQGAPNLDFQASGTQQPDACAATTYSAGSTCTVSVTFKPGAPGQRLGAVVLYDTTGASVATGYIYGAGKAPLAALTPGIVTTVAGNGQSCTATLTPCGSGEVATSAQVQNPFGVTVDAAGNIYIADTANYLIRKVDAKTGIISTVAGYGDRPYTGDGGPATQAGLWAPQKVVVDGAGNLYIADSNHYCVRKVDAQGIISTFAGTGTSGSGGDGGPASQTQLGTVTAVAVDGAGNVYIADMGNDVIRRVDAATGIITTYAGMIQSWGWSGDGGPATKAQLGDPFGLAVDSTGNVYIADTFNQLIRKVDTNGIITTIAGNGNKCNAWQTICDSTGNNCYIQKNPCGDGGPATSAGFQDPFDVAVDGAGNVYIADTYNNLIRKVDTNGSISTVAGSTLSLYTANDEGAPATSASFWSPYGVSVDSNGNLYIADTLNLRIRKVDISQAVIPFPTPSPAGSTDTADGTQKVTVSNIGNDALILPVPAAGTNPTGLANFKLDSTSAGTCALIQSTAGSPGSLAVGSSCTLPIMFAPLLSTFGPVNEQLVLTDTSLNAPAPAYATQTVSLSGTAGSGIVTLKSSAKQVTYGNPVTFTATVPADATGTMTFHDGTTVIASNVPVSSGSAVYTATALTAGKHVVAAQYSGDSKYGPDYSVPISVAVVRATPVITWPTVPGGYLPNPITYGTPLDATQLNATANTPGTFVYSPAAGTILQAGSYSISVFFTPNDLANYTTVIKTVFLEVDKAWLTVTSYPQFREFRAANPELTFTVNGYVNGDTRQFTGSLLTTALPSSPVGTYPIKLGTLTPGINYQIYFTGSTLTVTQAKPSVTVASSLNPSVAGQSVNLTATVPGGTTGLVQFQDGSSILGAVKIINGAATLTTSVLTTGTHSITATYLGDNNFSSASSSAISQGVTQATAGAGTTADFSISATPASLTVPSAGGTAAYALNVASAGGAFNNAVALSVTGNLPTGATASFNPSSVTPGVSGSSSVLTISVPKQTASLKDSWKLYAMAMALFPLGMVVLPRRRRKLCLLMVLALGVIAGMSGCGGNGGGSTSSTSASPQSHSYTITVTGTSGTLSHNTTLVVTVQ